MKKTSGSPRYSFIDPQYGEKYFAFAAVVNTHIGLEKNGDSPNFKFSPCQYWLKNILRDYVNRSVDIGGKPNVSKSPRDTLDRLRKLEKTLNTLSNELSDIRMHDQDTDEAIFYAVESIGNRRISGMKFGHSDDVQDHVRFLCFAVRIAINDISKFKSDKKKRLAQWPAYVEPDWHLVIDLARLYHVKKGNVEQPPWEIARAHCRNTSSGEKKYAGPFFSFVKDSFKALKVEGHYSNRALGDLIHRALDHWEKLKAQGFGLPM